MNESTKQMERICAVTDPAAARLVPPDTIADLAAAITSTPVSPGRRAARPRSLARRRWIVGVPLAAGLAVAALVATSLGHPGQRVGPIAVGPAAAQAQALSFTRHGGFIDVIVRDPLADPARYRAEFARYHLNITLRLLPVSPSIVGTVVYVGQSAHSGTLTPITARGRCYTGGGGSACPVGVRVPAGFSGSAQLVFGRAARPGEQYQSAASAFAPGEVMHGIGIHGRTVAQVLAQLRSRHVTVAAYNVQKNGSGVNLRRVPGSWYVYDADPWAPGQVMLFAGQTRNPPAVPRAPQGAPAASPSPASS